MTSKLAIAICADDYALHEGIDQAICNLLSQQRLSAVSCMSNMPRWSASALRLHEFKRLADIGLHFNLNDLGRTLPSIIARAYLRQVNQTEIVQQFHQQCDAFEKHMKQAPTFIDGHQHVHQLPIIRDILQEAVLQRYGNQLPWIRNTVPSSVTLGAKAYLLKLLGGATLKTQLRRASITSNDGFAGVYNFNTLHYAILFENWLKHIRTRGKSGQLLMCHPASYFSTSDKIGTARVLEYAFFNSNLFPQLLAQYQIVIQPLSKIIRNV